MLGLGGAPIAAVAVADLETCIVLEQTALDARDVVEAACIPSIVKRPA